MDAQTVSLRRWRLDAVARLRVMTTSTLCVLLCAASLAIGFEEPSDPQGWAWIAGGITAACVAVGVVAPLTKRRTTGKIYLTDDGLAIHQPAFFYADLFVAWHRVERISTVPIGDGTIVDGRLAAPTLVIVLNPQRSQFPVFPEVRRDWSLISIALGVRSNYRWPPPSRFVATQMLGLNLDCDVEEAEALARRWDAVLPRHRTADDGSRASRNSSGSAGGDGDRKGP